MRPFLQLPSVSGVDVKLGRCMGRDYARFASFSCELRGKEFQAESSASEHNSWLQWRGVNSVYWSEGVTERSRTGVGHRGHTRVIVPRYTPQTPIQSHSSLTEEQARTRVEKICLKTLTSEIPNATADIQPIHKFHVTGSLSAIPK